MDDTSDAHQTARRPAAAASYSKVYTAKELAELVAVHDREHSDHKFDCMCHNGILPALRTFFQPAGQPVSDSPRPYVPPDVVAPRRCSNEAARKPWLTRREGETKAQYDWRISHSCYNCGTVIADDALLNGHEDDCSAQGKRS